MRSVLRILPLLIVAGFVCTCSKRTADTFARIQKTRILRVGNDPTYPPFESKDTHTGKIVGFDIDLIDAICTKLDVRAEYVEAPFDGIIAGLNTDKYDCVISSMSIKPERAQVVDFSLPYYQAGQAIAVRLKDEKIQGVEDLKGKRIGCQLGTTGETFARTQIPDGQVISFDAISQAFLDLENGKLDAIINDRPTTERFIALKGTAKIVGPTLTSEDYGIAVRKGDARLLTAINNALNSLRTAGKFDEIKAKWFGAPRAGQPAKTPAS